MATVGLGVTPLPEKDATREGKVVALKIQIKEGQVK
jgi:hypothetical protein